MRNALLALASALLLVGSSACSGNAPRGREAPEATLVRVQNFNPLRVTVEVVSSGNDRRLGQVETNATETFTLPRGVNPYGLRIRVDPIGSTEVFLSDALTPSPGDAIDVQVQSNLGLTSVTLR